MIPDGAIGLLVGFMIGSISGVFCFALVVGASRDDDEDQGER
jgi:hypothetical protein